MPTLADGTFFSAMSPLADYERELKKADDAADVGTFVRLIRGMVETHWRKNKPQNIAVSRKMYEAMTANVQSGDRSGTGFALGDYEGNVSIERLTITVRPE